MKIKPKKFCLLKDVPNGSLFMKDGTIALKTEYSTDGSPDCYIVGSGEYFWGGTSDRTIRDEFRVLILKVKL
jgi:hypothetical protein